jgi:hypothetical protein
MREKNAGDEEKWNKPVLTMYGETVQKADRGQTDFE